MRVSPEILNLVPYKPGKPISEAQREYGLSEVIKLASNENPLGPSPMAIRAMMTHLSNLHRYPDPSCYELIQVISTRWNMSPSQIAIGNGSNELIDLLIRLYCEPGDSILTSQSAFVAYSVCAQAARVKIQVSPLKKGYQIDLEKMADLFLQQPENKVRLIFLPNPNNPTGTYSSSAEVKVFLEKLGNRDDVLIVFDEAYNEFVRASDYCSAQDFMASYSNVIVLRTLSKAYGLAGIRIGVMLAPPEVVEIYNRVRNPFNVNELAQVAGIAALQDVEFIRKSQRLVWEGLDYFYSEFDQMGIDYIPSQGNFVLFDTGFDAKEVDQRLLKKGIIMRPVLNYGFKTHLRLTVGLPDENKKAIAALKAVISELQS